MGFCFVYSGMDAQSKLDRLSQLLGVPLGRLEATIIGNTLTITSHLPGPPPERGGPPPRIFRPIRNSQ